MLGPAHGVQHILYVEAYHPCILGICGSPNILTQMRLKTIISHHAIIHMIFIMELPNKGHLRRDYPILFWEGGGIIKDVSGFAKTL